VARKQKDKLVVANASGFWGDEAAAVARQVKGGPIDYLTMDYLAEITMIILARQKAESEEGGYARDFVAHVGSVLEDVARNDITVVANAGGINPGACARALERLMEERGVRLPVAIVDGDDLMPRLQDLEAAGARFEHLDTGEPIGERLARVNSANAYIGARPIVAALDRGARIVITGRTYDAASVVAPIAYEFGWKWNDFDRLARALLAGHLIECGAQVTGGNYTLWREVPSYADMGYPLVEVEPDGTFVLTKHPKTGGLVSVRTATEQTLYEIGDPRGYASPDVVADFTTFAYEQIGPDRVRVSGGRGRPPTDKLKVSMTYTAGFKLQASVVVSGPDAVAKARKFAEIYWQRVGDRGLEEKRTDLIGHSACWGESGSPQAVPNELVLRFSARAGDAKPLQRMARELAGIALAGPAGICGAGGRPEVSPAFGYWPALIDRRLVTPRTFFAGESIADSWDASPSADLAVQPEGAPPPSRGKGTRKRVALARVAYSRSGDKGDSANVGVAALTPDLYPELVRELTAERVAEYFRSNTRGAVSRFRLDNLCAMNFLLRGALGGGGTTSLLLDQQGKTLAQGILNMEIDVAEDLLPRGEI
jgi:hypothetical protein